MYTVYFIVFHDLPLSSICTHQYPSHRHPHILTTLHTHAHTHHHPHIYAHINTPLTATHTYSPPYIHMHTPTTHPHTHAHINTPHRHPHILTTLHAHTHHHPHIYAHINTPYHHPLVTTTHTYSQGLSDCEETVVCKTIEAMTTLCREQVFDKPTLLEYVSGLAPFLVHPVSAAVV